MINPETNNRVKMQAIDAGTGEEVERGKLVKGYQVARDQYVLFTKDELDEVKFESTRIIDIEKFVLRAGIDLLYWDAPYHLVPAGKTGIEAFAVIREVMRKQGMVAIGRLVMSTRERVCAIEIEEDALLLTTLRAQEEVRTIEEIGHPDLPTADPRILEIAEKIVVQQSGDFYPAEFNDRYEDALHALIEEKKKGKKIMPTVVREADDTNVSDLMAALKKRLQGKGNDGPPSRTTPARPKKAANSNRRKGRAA
jgi:DNA end-binding protein Ku